MLSVVQAREKLDKPLGLKVSPVTKRVLTEILEGDEIKQRETFLDPESLEYVGFVEGRLAQEHIKYLAADQANGIYGGSTVKALKDLADVYGLHNDGTVLNSEIVRALLDGTKSPLTISSEPNSYQWFKKLVKSRGFVWQDARMEMNIIGIRGYMMPGGKVINAPDIYNDVIAVCYVDISGFERVEAFVASCDPGRYYYSINPINPAGCAHLKAGQYKYKIGIHRTYTALVQAGNVTVLRSSSGNPAINAPQQIGDYFGINIHAGTAGNTVYNASAGCQVIQSNGPNGWQWRKFINLVMQDINRQYLYTLFDNVN